MADEAPTYRNTNEMTSAEMREELAVFYDRDRAGELLTAAEGQRIIHLAHERVQAFRQEQRQLRAASGLPPLPRGDFVGPNPVTGKMSPRSE